MQRRPTWKRARYARIWMAANRLAVRAWGTRLAQMKRPEMRAGLARFRRGPDRNHRTGPQLVAGQHLKKRSLEGLVFSE